MNHKSESVSPTNAGLVSEKDLNPIKIQIQFALMEYSGIDTDNNDAGITAWIDKYAIDFDWYIHENLAIALAWKQGGEEKQKALEILKLAMDHNFYLKKAA